MGKIVRVKNKATTDSILRETVDKAQKRIKKQEKSKLNKVQASKLVKKAKAPKAVKEVKPLSNRKQRVAEAKKRQKQQYHKQAGVLFVSHIPHGFYEEQLQKFFSQFGRVDRVRLVRSTISGRSKGHAFVVFRFKEVAKIAAETADNFLMGKRILKVKVIPPDEVKAKWFYHTTPKNIKWTVASKRREKNINRVNKLLTASEGQKRLNAQKKTLVKMVQKLNDHGIDFKYNGV